MSAAWQTQELQSPGTENKVEELDQIVKDHEKW
jgi:hypothetical protein